MKAVVLALAVAWPLVVPAAPDSGLVWSRFHDARVGYTLRIPPDWNATVHHGATIVSSVRLHNRYDSPERIRLPRGSVYIKIFDYGPVEGDVFESRSGHLELGRKEVHTCGFGEGYMLRFRDRGRAIQAFVKLGPWASGRDALAVLNSLRVTK